VVVDKHVLVLVGKYHKKPHEIKSLPVCQHCDFTAQRGGHQFQQIGVVAGPQQFFLVIKVLNQSGLEFFGYFVFFDVTVQRVHRGLKRS
jgi:hypothetical protein